MKKIIYQINILYQLVLFYYQFQSEEKIVDFNFNFKKINVTKFSQIMMHVDDMVLNQKQIYLFYNPNLMFY